MTDISSKPPKIPASVDEIRKQQASTILVFALLTVGLFLTYTAIFVISHVSLTKIIVFIVGIVLLGTGIRLYPKKER